MFRCRLVRKIPGIPFFCLLDFVTMLPLSSLVTENLRKLHSVLITDVMLKVTILLVELFIIISGHLGMSVKSVVW